MVINTYEGVPFQDTRTIIVNGKPYHSATMNRCTVCTNEQYMFVKQRHSGGDVSIECPVCDYTQTLPAVMVRLNMNKPG